MERVAARSGLIKTMERLIVGIDAPPAEGIYRVAIGFLVVPVLSYVVRDDDVDAALVPFLFATLLMLRVGPALVRRLVPFSEWAQRTWADRRELAKRYDSYQWQKLLWVGIGLAIHAAVSGGITLPRALICSTFMLSGAFAFARFRFVVGASRYPIGGWQ